jgi:hypothetical protein
MHIGFEVVMAVVVKSYIFGNKHNVVWWKSTDRGTSPELKSNSSK